ncbi:MAG: ABC transporter substrate-binding protein [Proteobacteria bacterium]|nr:ABC transporter substrate-binding protein [Pseudomonadota bacterium]
MKRLLILSLCILLLGSSPASADTGTEVRELLRAKIDAVVALLRQKDMEKSLRKDNILELIKPIFDFKKMAKLTLGRKHWPGLSPEKKEEFSDLFVRKMQDSYIEKLDLYEDEEVVYEEPLIIKRKVHVPINFVSKDDKISMLYKFYRSKELGWQIYDVELQGVSVIQTYRTQFNDVLKNGTIDDLMAKLDKSDEFKAVDVK